MLATWRVHPQQATTATESSVARRQMLAMSLAAFEKAQKTAGNKLAPWPMNRLLQFYREQIVLFGLKEYTSRPRRIAFLAREIARGNASALKYVFSRERKNQFSERTQFDTLRALCKELNVPAPVFP